jgi:hypothetical protein
VVGQRLGKPVDDCLEHVGRKYLWLEKLVYIEKRQVILLVSKDPEDLIQEPGDARPDAAEASQRMNRWLRLLGQFVTLRIAERAGDDNSALEAAIQQHQQGIHPVSVEAASGASEKRLYALLRRECGGLRQLHEIGAQILRRPDCAGLSEDALIDGILEMAEGHYRAIWTILRQDERLVLAQVAAGSVVNPKCKEVIRHLLTRRLLLRDPELRLMNESFGRFLRQTMPTDQLAALERQGTASVWQQVRGSLYFGLAALAAFLFVTQRDVFNTASAFVSALTVGGVALVQLFDRLRPAVAKSSSESAVRAPQEKTI